MTSETQGRTIFFQDSLRLRIQVALIVVTFLVVTGGGSTAYLLLRSTLLESNLNTLTGVLETRSDSVELWLEEQRDSVELYSNSTVIQDLTDTFVTSIATGEVTTAQIRNRYLGLPALENARDGSSYSEAHEQYFRELENFAQVNDYNDIYIVDTSGNILFTLGKRDELGTNLITGVYDETNLAQAYNDAVLATNENFSIFVDFEIYEPTQTASMFVASPIFVDNARLGTLIFQIPIDVLDAIMNVRAGLGASGETYLVGSDLRFRSNSRFLDQLDVDSTILSDEFLVDTVAVRSAQNGSRGTDIIDDYRGVPVLSSWSPITIQSAIPSLGIDAIEWAVMAEIDRAEAFAPTNLLVIIISISGVIGVIFAGIIGFSIVRPLRDLTEFASVIEKGDLSQRANIDSQNEIGDLARAFNSTLDTVASRTRDVEAIVEVAARASTVLDEERLLQDVVDMTKDRFNLYHAHIYLLNDDTKILELKAGAGYVGRQMVSEERIISLSSTNSIVANTARNRRSTIANDVLGDANFLPHPLLPETRAELAVPLIARGEVLGVLDIQSEASNYFDSNVLRIIETLATQISSALSNVRLLEEAQRNTRHAQALSTIQQSMQSATTMDDVLNLTARELAKALRVPHTTIELGLDNETSLFGDEGLFDEEAN